jgi:PAS domain S-box-containing protein
MIDTDGYITSWNKGAEEIKGYKAEEILGRHISVFYTPEQIENKEPEKNLQMARDMGRLNMKAGGSAKTVRYFGQI